MIIDLGQMAFRAMAAGGKVWTATSRTMAI